MNESHDGQAPDGYFVHYLSFSCKIITIVSAKAHERVFLTEEIQQLAPHNPKPHALVHLPRRPANRSVFSQKCSYSPF